jgi:Ca-activated chloride channel family protein
VVVRIAYGSEKQSWLEEQVRSFAASSPKTKSGKPIVIEAKPMGSGEAVQDILSGSIKPTVFSPASSAYVTLLNQSWLSKAGHTQPLSPAGEPVVLSPVVIAMWKPMAEALGWPQKALGWADLLKVNADPKGWGAYNHPEWGSFKLGHTHPEFSNSGLLSVLAEAYAGAKKTRGLAAADLDQKDTQAFVQKVESSIVHYGKSTGFFADKMRERGPAYISAAVLYESSVIESYNKPSPSGLPLVAIYPVEGTFWSDHPYAILNADWVGADERDGAEQFLAFLKGKPAQTRALELGFRPADASIAINAPIDLNHGADPKQPQTLLDVPDATVLQKLLDVWQVNKRATDVELVFDKSGSMDGKPLDEAKAGATTFLKNLHDRDQFTIFFFDNNLYPPIGPVSLDKDRNDLIARVNGVHAAGGTSLYDATASAFDAALERSKKDPSRIHAVVVMTDGRDEGSKMSLEGLRARLSTEHSNRAVKVFTIAYGDEADPTVLGQIADMAEGTSVKGNAENIVQVYQDMASFF